MNLVGSRGGTHQIILSPPTWCSKLMLPSPFRLPGIPGPGGGRGRGPPTRAGNPSWPMRGGGWPRPRPTACGCGCSPGGPRPENKEVTDSLSIFIFSHSRMARMASSRLLSLGRFSLSLYFSFLARTFDVFDAIPTRTFNQKFI